MRKKAETHIVIRTFLASPGDVRAERELAAAIITELNEIWGRFLGIVLELVRWETHAYPGIGADAQAVINEQIEDDYEIFIGIMWGRFGTPTHRAESGTAEEFERAHRRYLVDPTSVRIMFYFKSAAALEASEEQIRAVAEFRERIVGLGVFPWSFTTHEEFSDLLKLHLSRQIQHDFIQLRSGVLPRLSRRPRIVESLQFLGLPFTFTVQAAKIIRYLHKLSHQTVKVGKTLRRDSIELRELRLRSHTRDDVDVLVGQTAESIAEIVADASPLIGPFSREFSALMHSVSRTAPFFVGTGPAGRLTSRIILRQLRSLHTAIVSGIPPHEELRDSMLMYPDLHQAFRRPAHEAAVMFDEIVRAWKRAGDLVLEAERTYRTFK